MVKILCRTNIWKRRQKILLLKGTEYITNSNIVIVMILVKIAKSVIIVSIQLSFIMAVLISIMHSSSMLRPKSSALN